MKITVLCIVIFAFGFFCGQFFESKRRDSIKARVDDFILDVEKEARNRFEQKQK
jgi:hypothetical protein